MLFGILRACPNNNKCCQRAFFILFLAKFIWPFFENIVKIIQKHFSMFAQNYSRRKLRAVTWSILFFDQNIYFWPKILIFGHDFNCLINFCYLTEILIFWAKFRFLGKILIFWHNFEFCPNYLFLGKISIFGQFFLDKIAIFGQTFFGQNFDFWTKFRFLDKISILTKNVKIIQKIFFFQCLHKITRGES